MPTLTDTQRAPPSPIGRGPSQTHATNNPMPRETNPAAVGSAMEKTGAHTSSRDDPRANVAACMREPITMIDPRNVTTGGRIASQGARAWSRMASANITSRCAVADAISRWIVGKNATIRPTSAGSAPK